MDELDNPVCKEGQGLMNESSEKAIFETYSFEKIEELDAAIRGIVKETEVVLDIGCGIRPMNFFRPKFHLLAEPWQEYSDILAYRYADDKSIIVLRETALETLKLFADHSIDSIFLLDVIEHMEKETGLQVLAECNRVCREQIVVFTPLGFMPQHFEADAKDHWGLNGTEMQNHLSGWEPKDFLGDNWSFYICNNYHEEVPGKYHGAFYAVCNLPQTGVARPKILSDIRLPTAAELEVTQLTEKLAQMTDAYNRVVHESAQDAKVSIIIPTHNSGHCIKEAINSALSQTYSNLEVIVIDDESTDNTGEVIATIADPRLNYIRVKRNGFANAKNYGLKVATGYYISFLNADGLYAPDKIALQVDYLKKHRAACMVYASANLVTAEAKAESQIIKAKLSGFVYGEAVSLLPNQAPLACALTYKWLLDAVGCFDESMLRFEDLDVLRRIAKTHRIDSMPEVLCTVKNRDLCLQDEDVEEIMIGLVHYADKLLQEKADIKTKAKNAGLIHLFVYFAQIFIKTRKHAVLGLKLMGIAIRYRTGRTPNKLSIDAMSLGIMYLLYVRSFKRVTTTSQG